MPASVTRIHAYLRFLIDHQRLLAFGVFTAALSGFGQTYYIGLFNHELRASFALSHSELGLVFGAATLAGAVTLIFLGRVYDRVELKVFVTMAAVILACGCALMAGATGVAGLLAALFLLRLGGQGLMGHIALTTMARRFHSGRGKAISVAAMGYPLAEAVLPLVAVSLLAVMGWRGTWWVGAAAVVIVFLPLMLRLLRNAGHGEGPVSDAPVRVGPDWQVNQVVRDPRFALIIPAALASPFVVTVAFFHQIPMAEDKGWSLDLIASGLAMFALGHVTGLLLSGPLVDRWSAKRVLAPALLPMIGAMSVLASFDQAWAALLWPALLGLTLGLASTAGSALLAELYGLTHLGSIRALFQALMICSTAIGPPAVGWLLDQGAGTELIASGIAVAVLMAGMMAAWGLRHSPPTAPR